MRLARPPSDRVSRDLSLAYSSSPANPASGAGTDRDQA